MVTSRTLNSTLDRMLTLNRAVDQAFNTALAENRVWIPAIDVVEKKDAYLLLADLPGVERSQVDISFEQNVLTIRGTKRTAFESANAGEVRVFAAERVSGTFERAVRLPEFVDGDAISARFDNGLLTVSVPKAKAAQARRIEISTGEQGAAQIRTASNN